MRSIQAILKAPFEGRHYRAALNMARTFHRPGRAFLRYLFDGGRYPSRVTLRTPAGVVNATLYSHHDLLTVNEVFCRRDYGCETKASVVVDFGSNIGISGLYFLTRNPAAHVYMFEPLPMNIERLRGNLQPYQARFTLCEAAVGLDDGEVSFGYESSGRYGGVGLEHEHQMMVRCRAANAVLEEIIARHGRIDVLKIDIESMEQEIVRGLGWRAQHIEHVFVEQSFTGNPLEPTHTYRQYGSIARFHRKDAQAGV